MQYDQKMSKKSKSIIFRVTEDEYTGIKQKSSRLKFKSISDFCRFVSLKSENVEVTFSTVQPITSLGSK